MVAIGRSAQNFKIGIIEANQVGPMGDRGTSVGVEPSLQTADKWMVPLPQPLALGDREACHGFANCAVDLAG